MDEMAGVAEKATEKSADKSKSASKISSSKVFDVSKPNKQPASATSRPVIIKSSPIMQDPMMTSGMTSGKVASALNVVSAGELSNDKAEVSPGAKSDTESEETAETSPSRVKMTIQPLSDNPDGSDKSEGSDKPEAAVADEVSPEEPAATAKPEDTKPAESVPDDIGLSADPTSDEKAAAQTKEQEAAAKQQAELAALTESKEYFLPINSVERRRSKLVALLGIILILALGLLLVNLMLDAGFISIPGVEPLTHIFSV